MFSIFVRRVSLRKCLVRCTSAMQKGIQRADSLVLLGVTKTPVETESCMCPSDLSQPTPSRQKLLKGRVAPFTLFPRCLKVVYPQAHPRSHHARWITKAGTTPKTQGLGRIPPDRLQAWELVHGWRGRRWYTRRCHATCWPGHQPPECFSPDIPSAPRLHRGLQEVPDGTILQQTPGSRVDGCTEPQ